MKGWRTGRKKTEYILLQCSRATVKAIYGQAAVKEEWGYPVDLGRAPHDRCCMREDHPKRETVWRKPAIVRMHEKVGCGRGTLVPDRESEELLCKDKAEALCLAGLEQRATSPL